MPKSLDFSQVLQSLWRINFFIHKDYLKKKLPFQEFSLMQAGINQVESESGVNTAVQIQEALGQIYDIIDVNSK